MSYYIKKTCAACGKPTACAGFKTPPGKLRFLCDRGVCKRDRAASAKRCPSCAVKTCFDDGNCAICVPARGRKVSTEGKAARGTTPDSGSIPGCSTNDELAVLQEDVADLQDENKKLRKELTDLKTAVETLKTQVMLTPAYTDYSIPATPTFPVPDFTGADYEYLKKYLLGD